MLHDARHAAGCGIALPKVMRFNAEHAAAKLALATQALGVDTAHLDEKQAALAAADTVGALMKEVRHPTALRQIGVPEEGLAKAGAHTLAGRATLFNARPVGDPRQVVELLEQAS